jgi:diguanylate cyclase (GGDEF)-like protein
MTASVSALARSLAIWAFIAALAVAATAVQLLVVPAAPAGRDQLVWFLVVAAGFLGAEIFLVHFRMGEDAFAFSLMELPLILGLYFVRPDLLLFARLLGAGLAFLWQRKPLRKAAFNLSLFALETAGAVTIWHLVVGGTDPLGARSWLATGAAVTFTSVLGSLAVTAVILITTGERPGALREVFGFGHLGDLANACFALVAVYILSANVWAAWLLLVVVLVLAVAHRSRETSRIRAENLEQLNRFIEVVGQQSELEDVVGTVLREVRRSFDAGHVQLQVDAGAGGLSGWALEDRRVVESEVPLLEAFRAFAADGSLLVPAGPGDAVLAPALRAARVDDLMLAPLSSEGPVNGTLAVADREGDRATYSAPDLARLQAFANHAALALGNAVRARRLLLQAEERSHWALHDELTGLPHRRMVDGRLGEWLAHDGAAALVLDLDRFKEVNDALGHETGDRLLTLVGRRLLTAVPDSAVVARLGGHEFAVVVPGAGEVEGLSCAAMVRASLANPFVIDGFAIAVDASVGVAAGEAGTAPVTVMRHADLAMYVAKENRSGVECFRPELDRSQESVRLGLLSDLRNAIAARTLEVHFQPEFDIATGRLIGAEALSRWEHPVHGRIGPDEFIPLAEHSSLITPLTLVVLEASLHQLEKWRRRHPHLSVSVNISPRSLLDPDFVDLIARRLAAVAVPASALTLEITETSLMSNPERAVEALVRLRALGVRLSVDDLGTGYSSLSYLRRLPVHEIKIDRSFVTAFPETSAEALVGGLVDIGHRLGLQVVAEGIEDEAALHTLRELGCDSAQGFWLARPMSVEAFDAWLDTATPARRLTVAG